MPSSIRPPASRSRRPPPGRRPTSSGQCALRARVRRRPLAQPRAAGEGAAAAPAGGAAGRGGEVFGELDVLDAGLLRMYRGFIVEFAVRGRLLRGLAVEARGRHPAGADGVRGLEVREPIGVVGLIMPWNGPTSVFGFVAAALAAGNSRRAQAGRADPMAAVLMAELASRPGSRPGSSTSCRASARPSARRSSKPPRSTRSRSPARSPRAAHPGGGRRAREARGARARRQEPVHRLRRRRPRGRRHRGDDGRLGRVGPGVHGRHPRARAPRRPRRGRRADRRALARHADRLWLRPGEGDRPGGLREQLERVQRYVAIGREEGAELVLGGQRHGDVGFFHEPTVFTGVRNDMRIAQEEIFGPVMSVLPFETEDEAYAIANDTRVRPGRRRVDQRPRARAPRRPGAPGGHGVGQHLPDGQPDGAVRRRQAVRPRPDARRASLDELTQTKSVWMNVGS